MSNKPQAIYVAEALYDRGIGGVFSTKEAADNFCKESRKIHKMCDLATREYVLDAKADWTARQYWGYAGRIEREPVLEDVVSCYTDNDTAERIENCDWDVAGYSVESYSLVSAEDCLEKAIRLRNKAIEMKEAKI